MTSDDYLDADRWSVVTNTTTLDALQQITAREIGSVPQEDHGELRVPGSDPESPTSEKKDVGRRLRS